MGTLTSHYHSSAAGGTSKSTGGSKKKFKPQFPSGLTASFIGNASGSSARINQQKAQVSLARPEPTPVDPSHDTVTFGGYVSSDTDEGSVGNAPEPTNQVCFLTSTLYLLMHAIFTFRS